MKMQEKKEDKLHKIKKEPTNIGKPTFTSSKIGAGDRTRFTFSSAKKIAVLFPSSREQATVHRTVAFRWVLVRRSFQIRTGRQKPPFFIGEVMQFKSKPFSSSDASPAQAGRG